MNSPVLSGKRKMGEDREFYLSEILPEKKLCVSVSGIFLYDKKVALIRNKRGREIPGGHIEEGESVTETLEREMYEELGTKLGEVSYSLWGYRKVMTEERKKNRNGGRYPYPFYYMPVFAGRVSRSNLFPTAPDVQQVSFFEKEEIVNSDFRPREMLLLFYDEWLKSN